MLGTGNRVLHFSPTAEVSCTFCVKNGLLPAPLETPLHIFFECPNVQPILIEFFEKYFNVELTKDNFFSGNFSVEEKHNAIFSVVLDIIRYSIWQFQL